MKQETHSNSKMYLIVVAIILIGGLLYYFYRSGGDTANSAINGNGSIATDLGGVNGGPEVGGDVLNLLHKISSLHIDNTIFADPAYLSLVDFSVEIPPLDVGRQNPFAPIPGSSGPQQAAATAASKTLPRK